MYKRQEKEERRCQKRRKERHDGPKDQLKFDVFAHCVLHSGSHARPAKEGIDIVPLDLQLIEDELAHEVVFGLMDDLLGSGILGDG